MKTWSMLLMTLLTAWLAGCGPTTFVVGVTPGDQRITQTVVESPGAWTRHKVAIIDLSGMIYNGKVSGLLSQGENPLSTFTEMLEAARRDDQVKAVILRINSPGGGVTASDAMYREVMRFKRLTGKPVVVLMMDMAASGAYYVSCAGDYLVAYPTTVTGSIGVIAQTISFKPALDSIGIRAETFASGPNKDAGSLLSTMTDGQRAVFQNMINEFYGRFVELVKTSRPQIPADQLAQATDGRIITGIDAVKIGLVDQLGDLHDAFDEAKKLAKIESAQLVVYHRPLEYVGSPYAQAPGPAPSLQVNLAQFNMAGWGAEQAGFYYLGADFLR